MSGPISLDRMWLADPRICACLGVRVRNADVLTPKLSAGDPVCSFCHEPITDLNDAWFELFDGPTLTYPGEPEDLLAAWAHSRCGPEGGYNIAFTQLLSDGARDEPQSWFGHLRLKTWFCDTFGRELNDAYSAAVAMRKRLELASPMRPVAASIPHRPPRTPDNPRNITTGMRSRVLERDGFRCRRCGHGPDIAPLVVDHVVPVAKGGTAAFDNLQTLCRPCNAGKSDREPHSHDLRVPHA